MKVGDKLICKNFPRKYFKGNYSYVISNNINRNKDMIIGKSYTILNISKCEYGPTGLRMLTIIGEIGECYYWSDYFYSEKEYRKLKLEKLESYEK